MTPTRRTRKTAKVAAPATQVVESQSSDDDSSDNGSVTRCVCGESHNVGLMVQCDKCEVWQHCECVGLEEEQIPDHYYCDYCQPNQHHTVNATRPKRLYDAASNAEEEEGSNNLTWSNTAPGSNSDIDAERQSKRRKKSPSTTNDNNSSESSSLTDFSSLSISTASTSMTNTSEKVSPVTERRSRRTKLPAEEEIEEAPKKKNCVSCKRTHCSCNSENNNSNKKAAKSHQQSNLHSHSHHSNSPKTNPKSNNNNNSNSSPHIMTEDSPYWDEQGRPTRESSPPAKVKYPHSKISFVDMNRRARQIMEALSKMQNDLLKQPDTPPLSDVQVTLDDVMKDRRKYAHSSTTTCSLSSASTIPIMDECSLLKKFELMEPTSLPHEETSLEILDRVNRDLIKFQRKFGSIQQTTATSIATGKTQRLASKR